MESEFLGGGRTLDYTESHIRVCKQTGQGKEILESMGRTCKEGLQ